MRAWTRSTTSECSSSARPYPVPTRRQLRRCSLLIPSCSAAEVASPVVASTSYGANAGNAANEAAARHEDRPSTCGRPSQPQQQQDEVRDLRRQVEELRQLVLVQQESLQQMHTATAATNRATQTSAPKYPMWRPPATPFEAQAAAIGDRRLLGLYDARYHSTKR